MDIDKAVSNDVFKPLVSIAIPGGIAVAPYVILAQHYIPATTAFWHDHDAAFTSIVVAVILAIGLMLEDLGALIESRLDASLDKKTSSQVSNWNAYLKLQTKDEFIAQRYIRTVVTRLKFELSMGPAIVCLWAGIAWIQYIYRSMSNIAFLSVSAFLLLVAAFLAWQAWQSMGTLAGARILLIQAMSAPKPEPAPPDEDGHRKKHHKHHK